MHEAAREATAADAEVVLGLARTARSEALAQRGGPLLVAALDAEPLEERFGVDGGGPADRLVLVGTIDDAVVGYALVRRDAMGGGPAVAVVDELYVLPDARGVGVGEALMEAIEHWAAERSCVGIDAVALPGDRATKNFFETFGLVARAIVVHRPLRGGEPEGDA